MGPDRAPMADQSDLPAYTPPEVIHPDAVILSNTDAVQLLDAEVPLCECKWRWHGRTTAYNLGLPTPVSVGTLLRYSFTLGWCRTSMTWCVDVRTGVLRTSGLRDDSSASDDSLVYEHVMDVVDRHGIRRRTILTSINCVPPANLDWSPAPPRTKADKRVLCALINRMDGCSVDVTRYFTTRHPLYNEPFHRVVRRLVATRHIAQSFLAADCELYLAFIYGDLSERVFYQDDTIIW